MPDIYTRSARHDMSRRITSLETLSPEAEKAFRKAGHKRKWDHGQVLLTRGQDATYALLVLKGRLRAVIMTPEGEERLLRWLEVGEIAGLSLVIEGNPFPADLIADGPTEVLHVERERLIDLIRSDGETALAIVRVLSMRVIQLMDVITETSSTNLTQKVWAALERLAQFHGQKSADGTVLRMVQSDVAHAIGASRQRVSLTLQKLQKQGRIRLGYRSITLLNGSAPC